MVRDRLFRTKLAPALFLVLAAGIAAAWSFRVVADDSPADATASKPVPVVAGATSQVDAIDGKKFHALLVGCTKYDNLDSAKWLKGPANDVDLMRRFFTERLKLPPQSIAVLSEAEAAAHGDTFRPTRTNIEREIQKLIDTAKEGDQVVLLMAGHGSQQPEQKDPDPMYLKPDGRDQIFLPCDCGRWMGKQSCVANVIADFEMRNWCKRITKNKARLWVVLDCCCSGWVLRELPDKNPNVPVARNVDPVDLGIPRAELDKSLAIAEARKPASRGGEASRGEGTAPPALDFGPQSPDYVGLYAAQREESEFEMPMPVNAEAGQPQRPQGLLTFAIVDILSRTSKPITYGELASLIRQRYPQWGRTLGPTPVVEGLAQDRVVLGVTRWPGRSRRQWRMAGSDLTVNEGSVEGLTQGSILALYPSIDQPNSETVLGYVEVQNCGLLESDVKPVKYSGTPAVRKGSLPDGGCFEVARTDFGSLRIKVGVDTKPVHTDSAATSAAANGPAAESLRKIAGELKIAVSEEGSLCEFADDPRSAQWVLQVRDGKLVLVSRDAADIQSKLPPEVPGFSVSMDHAAAEASRDMTRIARAQNLLNLTKADQGTAGDNSNGATADDSSRPNIELKILSYKSKSDRHGVEIDLKKGPLVLVPGNYIGWRMTNLGKSDVAVCLLYIDAGFGITAIYPRPASGIDSMLTRNGGTYSTRPAKVTADPIGNEHIVLIAVPRKAGSQSPDFSFLEQETLPKSRGNGEDNPALDSPLGRLLKNAMFGVGGSRGLDSSEATEAHLMLQSWRVGTDSAQ